MDINTVITSIITSGIIGVFISEYYQRKTLVKKMKNVQNLSIRKI